MTGAVTIISKHFKIFIPVPPSNAPDKYIEENGLKQVNDEGALKATVEKVIADNPQSVADYRAGKEKAIGFLVGQTMKAMQGKANPGMVNKLLKELL